MRGMTDSHASVDVRALNPDEYRAANTLFRGSMHYGPTSDEAWAVRGDTYDDGRVLGAFRDGTLVGTALSNAGQLSVPGGGLLPMAMVTGVGVRADQTRRGVVSAIMRAQLTGIPEPVATLRASEAVIYGRFGYGVATRGRTVRITKRKAVFRPTVPAGGTVRIMPVFDAGVQELLSSLYDAISVRRPGWAARPDAWWSAMRLWSAENKERTMAAVHTGPDGDDGFAVYTVRRDRDDQSTLHVQGLFGADDAVWAALWRFLVGMDLVDVVQGDYRALDEPVEELFTDRRAVETTQLEDETWLRLVDAPAALAARTFDELGTGAGSVVIEVHDRFLPANSGRYRIGDGPAMPVDEPAELTMDVDVLGQLYLGDVAPSELARAGRVSVVKSDALRVADRLFAVTGSPWCGTFF
jgi:predicted acetyltransferase